jgi:DNA-binding NarL/FixJ family response regulator
METERALENPSCIDVLLLAENRLVREALTRALNKKGDMRVSASAEFSPEPLGSAEAAHPDVLLLEADAFADCGLQNLEQFQSVFPGVKVVMLGMDADKEIFLRAVRGGAAGYLLKDASAAEIADAVRAVVRDEAVCPPKLCTFLFCYIAQQSKQLPGFYGRLQFGLTIREQQLVAMIGRGLRNKEIANELNVSDQTVKHHVHHVLRKLGASDRVEAVEVCRLHGMLA